MRRLREVLDKALERAAAGLTAEECRACFPTVPAEHTDSIDELLRDMLSEVVQFTKVCRMPLRALWQSHAALTRGPGRV